MDRAQTWPSRRAWSAWHAPCWSETRVGAAQMGGVAGVEAAEVNYLTLQPGAGLYMNALPRVAL